jgi:hypothetical protein
VRTILAAVFLYDGDESLRGRGREGEREDKPYLLEWVSHIIAPGS